MPNDYHYEISLAGQHPVLRNGVWSTKLVAQLKTLSDCLQSNRSLAILVHTKYNLLSLFVDMV